MLPHQVEIVRQSTSNNKTLLRIETLFHSIGFDVVSGPEIETDFYNFTALNIPENHPASDA